MDAPTRLSDSLYDDVLLPDESIGIRQQVRAFADECLRPVAHELNTTSESASAFRRDIFAAMAEADIFAIPFSKEDGGRGLDYPTLASMITMEELGYYSPGIASAFYDAHVILCGQSLQKANESIRNKYLPKLISGESVFCFATSEPDASTDLSVRSLKCRATPVSGGYRVDGHKRWITNAPAGDYVCLLCNTDSGLTMLLVDLHADGVAIGEPDLKMGNHPQLTSDIRFDNVFVPEERLIGAEGGGLRAALGSLTLGRAGIAANGVGMAQRALDFSAQYIKKRTVFGKEIASFQHWQFRYADHVIAIENARNLYVKSAISVDKGGSGHPLMAMAKILGSELAVDVARDAIQACGGYGFARRTADDDIEWPLEAIYRDAKIGEIYEGANEVQRWSVAREIFGRGITG